MESHDHEIFMRRCLHLASLGKATAPNPQVGAVIVHENRILAEGFHTAFGAMHAEAEAIRAFLKKYPSDLLSKSTLYVNLEPCAHFGKTPPCALLILEHKIPRVVVGCRDPFPQVAGKGIEILQAHGVEVCTDVLANDSRWLNRFFITSHTKQRPYVVLKWAQTADGFMALRPEADNRHRRAWITGKITEKQVHQWRSEIQAVMVGKNTALYDNPMLDCRHASGPDPVRVVIDRMLDLPESLHLFSTPQQTLVFNGMKNQKAGPVEYIRIGFGEHVEENMLKELHGRNIQSVMIEGGPSLLDSFIRKNLWDEARIFTGEKRFGEGIKAPEIHGDKTFGGRSGNDIMDILVNNINRS
jgi:diaminohydroxyphosphoribosylaminopyrimidine deaminase/5-amino-6-(5-phosphoribosylamino)uracil reductase